MSARSAQPALLWRLWRWMAVAVLIVGVITAALSYIQAWMEADDMQDAQLQQVALLVAAGKLRARSDPLADIHGDSAADARLLVQSLAPGAPRSDPPLPRDLTPGFHSLDAGGTAWRVYVTNSPDGLLAVAQSTDVRDDLAGESAVRALLPMFALIPLLLALAAWVLARALHPLKDLARRVAMRDDHDLRPLPEGDVPREVQPLVHAVNLQLGRQAAAMERQQRFVADAAHELRTPIAVLTLQLDNLQTQLRDAQAHERLDTLRGGLQRARGVVEQLLALARTQDQSTRARAEFVDPVRVVREVIAGLLPLAAQRGVDLGMDVADPVRLRADPALLHVLLRNAVDNAVRYTPRGGHVDVRVRAELEQPGGRKIAMIDVQDTGPGIAPEDVERAMQPFVRLRPGESPGTGLGLAIVVQAARQLGGSIELLHPQSGGLLLRYSQAAEGAP